MIIFQAAFETNLWAWRLQEKPSLSISFTLIEKFQWRHCSILCATPWSNLSDQTICLQANWEPQLLWQEFGHYCITQHSNFFWCMVLYIFIQVQPFRTTSAALFESYPFLTFINDLLYHSVLNLNIFDDLSAMILHVLWRPRFVSSQNPIYLHIILCWRFFAEHIFYILSCHVNCPPRSIWGTSFIHLAGHVLFQIFTLVVCQTHSTSETVLPLTSW